MSLLQLTYDEKTSSVQTRNLEVQSKGGAQMTWNTMRSTICDALVGIALALLAAYLFSLAFMLSTYLDPAQPAAMTTPFNTFIGGPLLWLLFGSMLWAPTGAALGVLIPRIVRRRRRRSAALLGACIGMITGFVPGLPFFGSMLHFTTMLYVALWAALYGYRRAGIGSSA